MSYSGFTWNLTAGEARQVRDLLDYYCLERPAFMYRVDAQTAERYIRRLDFFLEVSPDGATPTHGTADA